MTKQDLTKEVAGNTHVTAADVKEIIELAIDAIKASITKGEAVYLRGFGTFTAKHRAEKTARNIGKGTTIVIPAHSVPHFKPSKEFKVQE